MKFVIQRDQLGQAVQDVMKAVSSRTTIPILTGIKIDVTDSGITLTGSNSDISIETFIPKEDEEREYATIHQTGSIVLQAKFFNEIVRKLPEDNVEIEVDEQYSTKINSGNAQFHLNGLDPEEYPRLPQINEEHAVQLPADLLKHLVRQTVFAVSTSETRPILTGVNWRIEKDKLTCVATDSHRLALRGTPIQLQEELPEELSNVVIPGKSLNELSKIIDDNDEPVQVVVTENQVLFKTKYLLFFSRLLDGNYPDTSRLIPEDSKTEVIVKVKDLLQSIDRASLLAREGKNNVVKLSVSSDGRLEISSNLPEIGKVTENVYTNHMEGDELKISFSAKYMMDALKAIDGTDIKISFTGAMRPFLIRSLEDDSILQLILPVRTY